MTHIRQSPTSGPGNTEQDDYAAAVAQILAESRAASSLPPLDPATELIPAALAWTRILFGVVPADRLDDCYLRAMRNRESGYPLNASEIVQNWRQIQAGEKYKPVEQVLPTGTPEASGACSMCRGSGWATVPGTNAVDRCVCRKNRVG